MEERWLAPISLWVLAVLLFIFCRTEYKGCRPPETVSVQEVNNRLYRLEESTHWHHELHDTLQQGLFAYWLKEVGLPSIKDLPVARALCATPDELQKAKDILYPLIDRFETQMFEARMCADYNGLCPGLKCIGEVFGDYVRNYVWRTHMVLLKCEGMSR
jgi:hypothetical protein